MRWLVLALVGCEAASSTPMLDLSGTPPPDLMGIDLAGADLARAAASECVSPVGLADVSSPTTVVSSCTQAALQAALDVGGVITFSCAGTLLLDTPLTADKDTVLDGGGQVTLSGGGKTRILKVGHDNFESLAPSVTVQRLAFRDGKTTDVANTTSTLQGGAAIYRLGG